MKPNSLLNNGGEIGERLGFAEIRDSVGCAAERGELGPQSRMHIGVGQDLITSRIHRPSFSFSVRDYTLICGFKRERVWSERTGSALASKDDELCLPGHSDVCLIRIG